MKSLGRQIFDSVLFSLALSAIILAVSYIPNSGKYLHDQIWGIVIFSALLGILVAGIAGWGLSAFDAQSRPNVFLGITVLRMLLSMGFIGIVLFVGIEDRILWVADFFGVYLFYLVFEILTILSNLRAILAEGEKP